MAPPPADRMRPFLGEYEPVRSIAVGGMGAVFEVASRTTGVHYAAKTILKQNDADARARFRREAELLARCDRHPGIVKVHAYGEAPDGAPCMILDLVPGEGLDRLLEREPKLEPRRAAELARRVAEALAFVHERGIVHRDVKPSNILVTPDGAPRLTDFGLATARDLERLTKTGHFLGTLHYCAPEQAAGRSGQVGPWSDVYSLGAVLFHLLAGEPPIQGDTPLEVLTRLHDPGPARDLRVLAPLVPEALAAVVATALEKEPVRRYANGAAFAQDLERYLADQPTGASARFRRAEGSRRVRALVRLNVVLVALLLATLAGALLLRRSRRAHAFEAADEALAAARHALPRAPAPVPASDAAAAHARLAAAREALATAVRLGGADPARVATADALERDLALADAARELAAGAPARALEHLEGTPGGLAALAPDARLLHARALAATGRRDDARRELERLLPDAAASLRAEVAELLGDVCLASSEPAAAAASYGRALEGHPTHPSDLRAKRAGAAALAGDERLAFADLAALVPDRELAAFAADVRPGARLAPLAPALYLRATRDTDAHLQGILLQAANALAPPPEHLRPAVARAWAAYAGLESQSFTAIFIKKRPDASDVAFVRETLRHFRKALELDRTLDPAPLWINFHALALWTHSVDPEVVASVVKPLLDDAPDDPALLNLYALTKRRLPGEAPRLEALACARRGLLHIPPPRPDEEPEVRLVASGLVVSYVQYSGSGGAPATAVGAEADLPLLRAAAERAAYAEAWLWLGDLLGTLGHTEEALGALDRAEKLPMTDGTSLSSQRLLSARVSACIERTPERALAIAEAAIHATPGDETCAWELTRSLVRLERHARVLELFPDPTRFDRPELVRTIGHAALRLGKDAVVRAALGRLEALHSPDLVLLREEVRAARGH